MVVLQAVRLGHVQADGRDYAHDVYVLPDGHILPRAKSDIVTSREIEMLLQHRPEVIVVGRGLSSRLHVDERVFSVLRVHGVELLQARSSEVLRLFNDLHHRQRTAAIVHVMD